MKTLQKIDWLKWILVSSTLAYLGYSFIQALINLHSNYYYLNF